MSVLPLHPPPAHQIDGGGARRRRRLAHLRGPHVLAAQAALTAVTFDSPSRLFIFGFGYTTLALLRSLRADGGVWEVSGACTSKEKAQALREAGVDAHVWHPDDDGQGLTSAGLQALHAATHVLSSVPPAADFSRDPVLQLHGPQLASHGRLCWCGYLSSTSVYGDHAGAWVDESSDLRLSPDGGPGDKAFPRARAEQEWLRLHSEAGVPVTVFRLGGIYGPGRNVLTTLRARTAPTPTQRAREGKRFTSRVHVDDIVTILRASMAAPSPGVVFNCVDDDPAPRAEVLAFADALLRGEQPPPHGGSAALESGGGEKRVRNERVKRELGVRLRYPSYRDGVSALVASAQSAAAS